MINFRGRITKSPKSCIDLKMSCSYEVFSQWGSLKGTFSFEGYAKRVERIGGGSYRGEKRGEREREREREKAREEEKNFPPASLLYWTSPPGD